MSDTKCKFEFFCKRCEKTVTMKDGRSYEYDDGLLYRLQCPNCNEWMLIRP